MTGEKKKYPRDSALHTFVYYIIVVHFVNENLSGLVAMGWVSKHFVDEALVDAKL